MERETDYIQIALNDLTQEDVELLRSLSEKLHRSGPEHWLIQEISRKILGFEERRLRLVYFFARNLN